MDVLAAKDIDKEGFVSNEDAIAAISEKRIPEVQASELQLICNFVDKSERGFVVIPAFSNKVNDLAQETPQEQCLRRFGGTVGRQALNLRSSLQMFETSQAGRLDSAQFKKAMKHMAIALSDADIETLFSSAEVQPGILDVKTFLNKVQVASKAKAPPLAKSAVKPDSKVQSKIGQQGAKDSANSNALDSWEMEKKYKKNLEALKQEIEDRNREI